MLRLATFFCTSAYLMGAFGDVYPALNVPAGLDYMGCYGVGDNEELFPLVYNVTDPDHAGETSIDSCSRTCSGLWAMHA